METKKRKIEILELDVKISDMGDWLDRPNYRLKIIKERISTF